MQNVHALKSPPGKNKKGILPYAWLKKYLIPSYKYVQKQMHPNFQDKEFNPYLVKTKNVCSPKKQCFITVFHYQMVRPQGSIQTVLLW
jgi:hypothetical protein